MKAFLLKMVIKDSKPPIWRRIIVPAGITFSQLSMILNKAMGWSGCHLFEMEFYHEKIRVVEGSDEFGYSWGEYQDLEASTTFIREFLEDNKWFNYIYDFGDYWQHRVTVEKILDDYEFDYPQVVKYKGNCPPEDCGGIWGYYDKLSIMEDEDDPEHEEIVEWMEGYPEEYDMEYVNEVLKNVYFYKWGKKETRSQREIREEHFAGQYGLRATKRDKNKLKDRKIQTEEEQIKELQALIEKLRLEREELLKATDIMEMDMMPKPSLKNIFHNFDIEDIRAIATDDKGLKRIKSLSKSKLIDRVTEHMLKPEEMKKYFLCLNDTQIRQFEAAIDGKAVFTEFESDGLFQLYKAAYVGLLEDGTYVVPTDVIEVYNQIDTPEFHKNRVKMSFLLDCLITANVWYGITPLSILKQMTDRALFMENMTEDEIKEAISVIPPEYADFVVKGETIYSQNYYPDDQGLFEVQADKEFYIPDNSEIRELAQYGYLPSDRYVKGFKEFLKSEMGATQEEANGLAFMIQNMFCVECSMDEILRGIEEAELSLKNQKTAIKLMDILMEMNNNTRSITHRGFTPNELGEMKRPKKPVGTIVNIEDRCKKKVY